MQDMSTEVSKASHCSQRKVCFNVIRERERSRKMETLSIQFHMIHALMIYDVKCNYLRMNRMKIKFSHFFVLL